MDNSIKEYELGQRLLCVAGLIRDGAVLCDVGTDHAKLPIYLVQNSKIAKAYATDINEGPIKNAEKNVRQLGLSSKIECIRTDGLERTDGLGVTDISICGMGGELISGILDRCKYIRTPGIQLVLQPMTHTQDLRRYLWDNGFSIDDEVLVSESDKLYIVIKAHFCAQKQQYTEAEAMLGKILVRREHDALFLELCNRTLYHLENKQKSTDKSEADAAKKLYDEIKEVIG